MDKKPFEKLAGRIGTLAGGKLHEDCFLVSLCLLIVFFNLGSTTFDVASVPYLNMLGSLVRYALLGIMLVNALLAGGSYSVRELILIALTGGCILISAMRTNDKTLLFTLIVIIAARDIPMKRIAKVYFWTYLSIITVVFVLFFLKVLPDYTMERGEDLVRHSLGFNHPNLLGRLVFTEIISFALGYPERARNRLFSVCGILAAVFVWFVPNSRTAFLCIVLYVVLMLFSQSAFMRSSFARAGCYIVPDRKSVV